MESAEHASIGDALQLTFDSGSTSAAGLRLRAHPTSLTYGQDIALGGDFFGVVGGPISTTDDHKAAFVAAYGSLATNSHQIATIIDIMRSRSQPSGKQSRPTVMPRRRTRRWVIRCR